MWDGLNGEFCFCCYFLGVDVTIIIFIVVPSEAQWMWKWTNSLPISLNCWLKFVLFWGSKVYAFCPEIESVLKVLSSDCCSIEKEACHEHVTNSNLQQPHTSWQCSTSQVLHHSVPNPVVSKFKKSYVGLTDLQRMWINLVLSVTALISGTMYSWTF